MEIHRDDVLLLTIFLLSQHAVATLVAITASHANFAVLNFAIQRVVHT
jgi:hypothetical protein